jgi:hypothetical protein
MRDKSHHVSLHLQQLLPDNAALSSPGLAQPAQTVADVYM